MFSLYTELQADYCLKGLFKTTATKKFLTLALLAFLGTCVLYDWFKNRAKSCHMSSHLGKTRTNRGFLPRVLCVFLDSARIHCCFSFNLWLVYRIELKVFCVTPVFPCYVLFCLFQSNLSLQTGKRCRE